MKKARVKARVMSFGYDSALRSRSTLGIEEVAHVLLVALRMNRKDCVERPLLLIGHSLGGLVVKKVGRQ